MTNPGIMPLARCTYRTDIKSGMPDLGLIRWGTLRVDHKTMMTSLDGVFAGGDIVRGASLVVWAVRDGRDLAEHMHRYLKAKVAVAASERLAA